MHLIHLSKYLADAFILESFIHNGAGKALPLCLYSMKYSNKSLLPYHYLSDNTIG